MKVYYKSTKPEDHLIGECMLINDLNERPFKIEIRYSELSNAMFDEKFRLNLSSYFHNLNAAVNYKHGAIRIVPD